MNLNQLYYFKTLAELEHYTKAAEKLNMAQPAVSLAIRELEAFYNVRLFERMNRRIFLSRRSATPFLPWKRNWGQICLKSRAEMLF